MDVMEGDDDLKQDLAKEIVKTPGVALRSTSRRARATPGPLPTPATLRRSTRTAARKAAAPVEAENLVEDVSTVKRTTGRASARKKMMVVLDQEAEAAAATPKVQQEEPKAVASDVKCDDPEEEEVTKLLEGDNKEEELEEGEEADSSDSVNGSALVSDKDRADLNVEEGAAAVEQEASKQQEGTVLEQEPMEDSPILGVLSKSESTESDAEKTQDAFDKNEEGAAEWSPVDEMTDEISPAVEDKAVAVGEEVAKEDSVTVTGEALRLAEDILTSAETSEEKEVEAEATKDGTTEDDELDEDEEWSSDDDDTSDEIDSTDDNDDENDETNEEGDCTEVMTDFNEEELVQMMQDTAVAQEASEDSVEEGSEDDSAEEEASEDGSAEEDDFTSDLLPEFDNIVVFSDAKTESDNTPPVLEENPVAAASATKTTVKSLDDSVISLTNEEEVSDEKDDSEEATKEVASTLDTIVKSLDEFTIKEVEDYNSMSLRQLKATYKNCLAAKGDKKYAEAKRLPLEEVDNNASSDC